MSSCIVCDSLFKPYNNNNNFTMAAIKRSSDYNTALEGEERFELEKGEQFTLFLVISKLNGVWRVHIRKYFQGTSHTRYGVCFSLPQWYDFVRYVETGEDKMMGFTVTEKPTGVMTIKADKKDVVVYLTQQARAALKIR